MLAILGILAVLALAAVGTLWEAYVVVNLWSWFVVPTFHLPAINYPVAIGIACLVGLLTRQYSPTQEDKAAERMIQSLSAPGVLLLVGWIAKQYL